MVRIGSLFHYQAFLTRSEFPPESRLKLPSLGPGTSGFEPAKNLTQYTFRRRDTSDNNDEFKTFFPSLTCEEGESRKESSSPPWSQKLE